MHGVRSDTDNFVNATPLDYSASEFLSRYVDKDLLSLISRQSILQRLWILCRLLFKEKTSEEHLCFQVLDM